MRSGDFSRISPEWSSTPSWKRQKEKRCRRNIHISLMLSPNLDFQVACCNAFDGLLVLGTDQGELLIYQQLEVNNFLTHFHLVLNFF